MVCDPAPEDRMPCAAVNESQAFRTDAQECERGAERGTMNVVCDNQIVYEFTSQQLRDRRRPV